MEVLSLDNGLQYIFQQRKDTGVVALQVWVKVGSKYEEPKIAGITHFIEHLIFKGTEKVKANEMASRIESLGGVINAYTSYDNTVYHIVIPAKAFEEGFELLVDAVKNPAFPEEEVNKEKKVVLEEIKMGEDDPQRKLFKELFSASYDIHPYGRPIIGYEDTVKNIQRDEILNYFRKHYTPDNMAVVVVGDFDAKTADALIKKHFFENKIPLHLTSKKEGLNNPAPAKEDKGGLQKQGEVKEKIIEKNVRESYLAIAYRIPSMVHEDTPALEMLGTILGEGESSRLQEQLKYKKGIVTNSSTYLFTPKEEGLFVIFSTLKGKDYQPAAKAINDELTRLLKEGTNEWEMTKAKNMIKASYVYSLETVQGAARQLGNFQTLTGDPLFVERYLENVDRVTEDDIKRVLQKYILGKDKTLVALLPKAVSNPHTFRLENGLTMLVNKNQASPSFAFRIGFAGGLKEEPPGKNGVFNVLSKMLLRGTKDKSAGMIAREIDMLAGDMGAFAGKNIFGLSGKFLSKDIKEVLGLLKELLTSTVFKEEELKTVKGEALSEIRQRDDDPISNTFMRFNETLYEGHPYGRDPVGREGDIENAKPGDIEEFYKKYVSPSNAVLAISGDVDEKELKALFENLFSEWKGKANPMKKLVPAPSHGKNIMIEKDMMQTHLIFGFTGPGLLDEDRYATEVMDAILSGMGGRIHKVLREERPYAYALTFFNQMVFETGGMGIYIGTDKKLVKEVEKISRAEIEKIVKDGFTDTEVENAKNHLIGTHYIRMQSNSAISTSMCLDAMYGLKPNYFKTWPKQIEKVKKEDVNKVARKYLLLDKMVQITVGSKQ
ncbi:MAG: pitrilysin family protein [Deltaproteobacteria bacterium]